MNGKGSLPNHNGRGLRNESVYMTFSNSILIDNLAHTPFLWFAALCYNIVYSWIKKAH